VKTFDSDALVTMYPDGSWGAAAPGRCTGECTGVARYVKDFPTRRYAHVELRFSPANELSVTLAHDWPVELGEEERRLLDAALLSGVVDGLLSVERPTWRCAVSSVAVGYVPNATSPEVVRATAKLATDDALRKPEWVLPSSEPA
jgi:hypothetical protein